MNKRLAYIALLFTVVVAIQGGPNQGFGRQRPNGQFPDGFGSDGQFPGGMFPNIEEFQQKMVEKLCSNQTAAQMLLAKIQQVIATLQFNGSFDDVLADRKNMVAFIQSSGSAARLSSNCAGFFADLKSAKDADDAVLKARFQYYRIAAATLMKTIGELVGANFPPRRQ